MWKEIIKLPDAKNAIKNGEIKRVEKKHFDITINIKTLPAQIEIENTAQIMIISQFDL